MAFKDRIIFHLNETAKQNWKNKWRNNWVFTKPLLSTVTVQSYISNSRNSNYAEKVGHLSSLDLA